MEKNNNLDKLLKQAKLKFFKKELMFFALQSYKFKWIIEDPGHEQFEAYVQFKKENPLELESGSIYFNERILKKKDYNYLNFCFVVCHELLHILHRHGERKQNCIHKIWAVACDHVVERELKKMNNIFTPFNNRYNIIEELDDIHPNCTTMEAYNWLLNNKQFETRIKLNEKTKMIEVYDQNDNLMYEIFPQIGGSDQNGNITQDEKNKLDQYISEVRAVYNEMKKKGNISENISEFLDKILKVEIPWEELLEKAIKTNTILKPDERNWKQLNKYYIPHSITLPGLGLTEVNEGVGILIIGVDTSGSINTTELKQFAFIIENSMKYFEKILVITHDVKIHQIEEFTSDNILKFQNFITNIGFKGRGGTSHHYLFDKIEELWDENPDELSMIISLTDMESDIQNIYKRYKFIKNNLPLVFLMTPNSKEIKLEEIGKITQIQIKEKN